MLKDLIIIGAGPGGMSAALYAGRAGVDTLVLEKEPMAGGQMLNTSTIENYIGGSSVEAFELANSMYEQVKGFSSVEFQFSEEVKMIHRNDIDEGHIYMVETISSTYFTKTIIIASGTHHRELSVNGVTYNHNNVSNVSYCATCDFPFYKDSRVAVIGGGDSALEAAQLLSEVASQVDLIHYRDSYKAKPELQEQIYKNNKIKLIVQHEVAGVVTEGDLVKELSFNKKGSSETKYNPRHYEGVFPNIGIIPNTHFMPADSVSLDGSLVVDGNLELYEDEWAGVWAIGDVTSNSHRQVSIAAGQGAQAALSVYEYLKFYS